MNKKEEKGTPEKDLGESGTQEFGIPADSSENKPGKTEIKNAHASGDGSIGRNDSAMDEDKPGTGFSS